MYYYIIMLLIKVLGLIFLQSLHNFGLITFMQVLKDLSPVIVGIVAILFAYINTRMTVKSKRIEERKAEIYKKLNELYGPLAQLRAKSKLLYDKFSNSHKSTNPQFKTLTFLLEGGSFSENDKILLKEIIEIGKVTEKLIHEKAGLIDDEDLRIKYLPQATTHFLIIRLAYDEVLKGESDKFKDHTFPVEIDRLIETRIQNLQEELKKLK